MEVVVAYFKAPFQHLCGRPKKIMKSVRKPGLWAKFRTLWNVKLVC